MKNKRTEWLRIEKVIFDLEILRIKGTEIQKRRDYGFFSGMARIIETKSKTQCHKRYENQIKQKNLTFEEYLRRQFKEHHSPKKYFDLFFEQYKTRLNKIFIDDKAEIMTRCDQVIAKFQQFMKNAEREEQVQQGYGLKIKGPSEYYQRESSNTLRPPNATATVSNESVEQGKIEFQREILDIQASECFFTF